MSKRNPHDVLQRRLNAIRERQTKLNRAHRERVAALDDKYRAQMERLMVVEMTILKEGISTSTYKRAYYEASSPPQPSKCRTMRLSIYTTPSGGATVRQSRIKTIQDLFPHLGPHAAGQLVDRLKTDSIEFAVSEDECRVILKKLRGSHLRAALLPKEST